VTVKRHPVTVSASPGALVSEELRKPYFAFDERWLKALTASRPSKLSIVRVEGDSMAPTLNADDEVLVDLGDCEGRLGDGIYVLRIEDAYPVWPDCSFVLINCIGRVIWAGRRIV
jgi:phage repressor protein C with HTH and peptisase S24 domain